MRVWIAIWTGSSVITKGIADWIRGGAALRVTVVFLAAGFLKGLPWTTYIVVALAHAWLITAVYLGLRLPDLTAPKIPAAGEPEEQTESEAMEEDHDSGEEPLADGERDVPRQVIVETLHGLLKESGGVHLKNLAYNLPFGPWKTGQARALLASHSIRVRPGVRVPGVGGREGVHRDDIPPLSSPDEDAAPVADVAAGQSNNNNGNNADGPDTEIVQDEVNPQRWHVIPRRPRAAASTSGTDET